MGRLSATKGISLYLSLAATLVVSFWGNPSLAGDPFRAKNARDIGDKTEKAFEELFVRGNYQQAKKVLIRAVSVESDEPLAHAMLASLAYTEKDWETIKDCAIATLKTAEVLKDKDPVRGHLYLAVGHFLEGTYMYHKDGPIAAITKLQKVFHHFDKAEDINSKDPELNLIKGYMDLMLAVNLPFTSPEQAIERFESNASPKYLVDRGIAIAYRDLDKHDRALEFADLALEQTPKNPEVQYLKAQILRSIARRENDLSVFQEALEYFDLALKKVDRLPESVAKSLRRERRKTQERLDLAEPPIRNEEQTLTEENLNSPRERLDPAEPLIRDEEKTVNERNLNSPRERLDPAQPLIRDRENTVNEGNLNSPSERLDPAQPLIRDEEKTVNEENLNSLPEILDPAQPLIRDEKKTVNEENLNSPQERLDPAQPLIRDEKKTLNPREAR